MENSNTQAEAAAATTAAAAGLLGLAGVTLLEEENTGKPLIPKLRQTTLPEEMGWRVSRRMVYLIRKK